MERFTTLPPERQVPHLGVIAEIAYQDHLVHAASHGTFLSTFPETHPGRNFGAYPTAIDPALRAR